jgi:hypothetical protein
VLLVVIGLFTNQGSVATANEEMDKSIVILGLSKIELNRSITVGVQINRVIRDCLWNNSPFGVQAPAGRVPKNSSDVAPYVEGNRVREMGWSQVLPFTAAQGKELWG